MSDLGNKEIMAENIKFYLRKTGKTRIQVCSDLGFKYSTFCEWINGNKYPRIDKIELLSKYFGIEKSDLVEKRDGLSAVYDNIYRIEKKKFPILGSVACGQPIYASEDRESYIIAGTDIHADFCLICEGDSMINARIYDGDIVFVRKQDIVQNGDIAVVLIDDSVTLKRFYYYPEENLLILKAENPRYRDMEFRGEPLNQIRVLGKAIAFQSDVI